ncbi:MAG: hypothetical protein LKE52_03255 [Bacilli bacterium]|jgi:hypothetical protein|nr:hypothetical protein [Bacilli bacterium]
MAEKRNRDGKNQQRIKGVVESFRFSAEKLVSLSAEEVYSALFPTKNSVDLPSSSSIKYLIRSPKFASCPDEKDYLAAVILALSFLPGEEGRILWNYYFRGDHKEEKNYSRSGFYRLRSKALSDFFTAIDKPFMVVPDPEEA